MDDSNERYSRTLFRVAGVDVAVDLSWIVIFLLVLWSLSAGYFPAEHPNRAATAYWVAGSVATLLFFASVVIHELSHSLVANRLGEPVRRITLFVFGGMAHLSSEPKTPASEMKIAAIGPLTSLLLAALFWGLAAVATAVSPDALATAVLRYLAFLNVALAAFNLLPGFPLDGGRLLRAFFWHRSGNLREATARAADWGSGIAIGIMVLGGLEIFAGALVGGLWLVFIGLFLRAAARAGYFGVVFDQSLRGTTVAESMVADPVHIDAGATVAEAVEDFFLKHGYAAFPVTTNGDDVAGLVSLSQVRRCDPGERDLHRVDEIMEPAADALRIPPSATLSEALRRMTENGTSHLLVTDDGHLEGLISRSMILRRVQVHSALAEPSAAAQA